MKHITVAISVLATLWTAEVSAQAPKIAVPAPVEKAVQYADKNQVTPVKSEMKGVSIVQTEYFGGLPPKFEGSVLAGKEVTFDAPKCSMIVEGQGCSSFQKVPAWKNYTDGKFAATHFLIEDKSTKQVKMMCLTPVKNLSRVRVTVGRMDPARSRPVFTVIALVKGKWIPVTPQVSQKKWLRNPGGRGYQAFLCFDFTFEKGSVPAEIEGIGILDETAASKLHMPRYAQIEAK